MHAGPSRPRPLGAGPGATQRNATSIPTEPPAGPRRENSPNIGGPHPGPRAGIGARKASSSSAQLARARTSCASASAATNASKARSHAQDRRRAQRRRRRLGRLLDREVARHAGLRGRVVGNAPSNAIYRKGSGSSCSRLTSSSTPRGTSWPAMTAAGPAPGYATIAARASRTSRRRPLTRRLGRDPKSQTAGP